MAAVRLDTEVVVVGAGPVGLMLAGELRLGGADVVVLEQRQAPTTQSRASTLHARTMEILDSRGLLAALGTPPCEVRGHFGGIPLDLTLPSPYPGQWKVPQARTERLLHDWAWGLGVEVRRSHVLRAVRATDEAVEVVAAAPGGPVRVRARYVVGCDGEQSTLRRLLGARFPGQAAQRELLRADVEGITIGNRRFQRLERGLAIAARREDGVTRVMVHAFGTRAGVRAGEPDFAEVCDAWKRVTGEDISSGTPLWVNSFDDACRQLERYRHGRVLFAGDAAHRQMPIGGQALNLGLQDALNLGWKLASVVRGRCPDALLDTYHQERHAVGRRVLGNIRAQALLLLGGPEVEPLREVLGAVLAPDTGAVAAPDPLGDAPESEGARQRLAAAIAGLDVRYGTGPGDHPLLGARLPQLRLLTPQGPATTTELLRAGRGLLLDLTGSGDVAEAARAWSRHLTVARGEPEPDAPGGAGVLRGAAVLVRPDGHVVWLSPHGTQGLHAALTRWFGPAGGPAGT